MPRGNKAIQEATKEAAANWMGLRPISKVPLWAWQVPRIQEILRKYAQDRTIQAWRSRVLQYLLVAFKEANGLVLYFKLRYGEELVRPGDLVHSRQLLLFAKRAWNRPQILRKGYPIRCISRICSHLKWSWICWERGFRPSQEMLSRGFECWWETLQRMVRSW